MNLFVCTFVWKNITREKCGENIDAAENKSVIVVQRGTSLGLDVEHEVGLDVEHGRVVRHCNGVVLGQGLAHFLKSELGFELKIRSLLSELIYNLVLLLKLNFDFDPSYDFLPLVRCCTWSSGKSGN